MHIIGRGRYAGETYQAPPGGGGGGVQPAFAFDQNDTPYAVIVGDPALAIASAGITVAAGSRIKIEARTVVIGSVADGNAIMFAWNAKAIQGFSTTTGSNRRTLNLLEVTDVQPGGLVVFQLFMEVGGAPGARVDAVVSTPTTTLTLTEIPA